MTYCHICDEDIEDMEGSVACHTRCVGKKEETSDMMTQLKDPEQAQLYFYMSEEKQAILQKAGKPNILWCNVSGQWKESDGPDWTVGRCYILKPEYQPEPAKYRKKPVVVEAMHYNDDLQFEELKTFVGSSLFVDMRKSSIKDTGIKIKTLEGNHAICKGDFIIKGVKGEFYPCKPDIFEQTYEKVED